MTKENNQKICDLLYARDMEGMKLLFRDYYTPLVLWANTFLNDLPAAEDLVQEFFIAVWEDKVYEKFHPHNLISFLRLIIKNKALNKLKKKDLLRKSVEVDHLELVWEEYNEHREQIINAVQQEISSLSPRSKEIMYLVFQKEMKYQEVADLLNISLSTVKSLVVKSIGKLKEKLDHEAMIYLFYFFKDHANRM